MTSTNYILTMLSYRPRILYFSTDLCSYLVEYMNCRPLRDGLINSDFLPQICDIFNRVPSWWQESMLKFFKILTSISEPGLEEYLLESDMLSKIVDTLVNHQRSKNLLFSNCWSIFKVIEKLKLIKFSTNIWDKFGDKMQTTPLRRIICPMMQMINRWNVRESHKPHSWAIITENESENDGSTQIFPFNSNCDDSPIKRLLEKRRERYSNE